MNADPNLSESEKDAVRKMLSEMGVTPAEPTADNESPAPTDYGTAPEEQSILSALDMSKRDDVTTYPLEEGAIAGLAPPEKKRIRRVPDKLFGRGREAREADKEDPWSRRIPELGDVTVSSGEKDIFFKCLLNNQRTEFPVAIPVGPDRHFKVTCRTLTPLERETVGLAVDEIAKSYPNKNLEKALLVSDYYLKMATLTQITKIEGVEDWKAFDLTLPPDTLPEDTEIPKALARRARLAFSDANQLRIYVNALHLFEAKILIMEDAMANRDFWEPADTN